MLELLLVAACVHQHPAVNKAVIKNSEYGIRVAQCTVNPLDERVSSDMNLTINSAVATTYRITRTPDASHFAALLYIPLVLNVEQPVPEDIVQDFYQSIEQEPVYLGTWHVFLENRERITSAVYIESTAVVDFDPVLREYQVMMYSIAATTVTEQPAKGCTTERICMPLPLAMKKFSYKPMLFPDSFLSSRFFIEFDVPEEVVNH